MSGQRKAAVTSNNGVWPERGSEDGELSAGSAAILRALSADGDLSWLTNVGNVTDMFKRLSQVIEDVREEARLQVQEEMDRSLAQVKVALNETVEVSSQRNEQLEMAVAAAEQAFRERDEARSLLEQYTSRRESTESRNAEQSRLSAGDHSSFRKQLRELKALVETYHSALQDSEARLESMAHESRMKDSRIEELQISAEAGQAMELQVDSLNRQLETQRLEQRQTREAHDEEVSICKQKLYEAQDRLAAAKQDIAWLEAGRDRLGKSKQAFNVLVARQQESIEALRAEFLSQHQSDGSGVHVEEQASRHTNSDMEGASLGMFHVRQLQSLLKDEAAQAGGEALTEVQQEMNRTVESIADTILSDTRRLGQYEAHIERLSTDLMETRKLAIEMRIEPVADEQLEELQRQVTVHKKKEARLEARIAELDALLERRTSQMHTADLHATELQRKLAAVEAQLAAIRSARRASAHLDTAEPQYGEGYQMGIGASEAALGDPGDANLRAEPNISINKLATDVEDMKIFRQSAEELLEILRVQLEQASDRNQELEEKTRKLTHDRDDLQDEIRRMHESFRASRADLDSAHHRSSLRSSQALPSEGEEDGEYTDPDEDDGAGGSDTDPVLHHRPRTAPPSSSRPPLHGSGVCNPVEPEVPDAVMARAAEYAGDEGLARPRTASPSSRNISGEVPAPPEVIERAALYSGEEGDTRPLTAAPSRRPDAAVAAPQPDIIPVANMADSTDFAVPSDEECSGDNISVDVVVPAVDLRGGIGSGSPLYGPDTSYTRSTAASGTQEQPIARKSRRPPGRGTVEARAHAAREETEANRRQQREVVIDRLRAEQVAPAGSSSLRYSAMDEEVVMRALRRAGLVQEELRQRSSTRRPTTGSSRRKTSTRPTSIGNAAAKRYTSPPPQHTHSSGAPRSLSAGRARARSLSAGRARLSQSTGKQRAVSSDELVNPAGVLVAGMNAQNEARWLWSRYNPSQPFHPDSFSSVLRSRVFDDCARQRMVAGKPRRREPSRRP